MGKLREGFDQHYFLTGIAILVLGYAVAFLLLLFLKPIPAIAIGGIVVLFFCLMGFNFMSSDEDLSTGEVQRSITFAVLYVFFALMAFGDQVPATNSILEKALENFWVIVLTVIGFYFGGRALERFGAPLTGPVDTLLKDQVWEVQKILRSGLPKADLEKKLADTMSQTQKGVEPLLDIQNRAK